jgi:translation initiation factor IF-3
VPIPRRFDRRPPERDQTRINERIRVPEVRLIGDDGQQVGVVKTDEALKYAQERDLDLVEVAPEARPPVVRVLDYSKYKYEQEQKAKAARRHQKQITIREIKLRPKIANNDYETKKGHVRRFLGSQDKVKITIMFRGRETTHPERGEQLLMRLAEDVADLGAIEQRPNLDGRNMTMVLGPVKAKEAGADGGDEPKREDSHAGKDSRRNRAAAEAAGDEPEREPAEAQPAEAEAEPQEAEQQEQEAEQQEAAEEQPASNGPAAEQAAAEQRQAG